MSSTFKIKNKEKSSSNRKSSIRKITKKSVCDTKTLNNCKVIELKEIARKSKCIGYSKKKKDELITLIKKCRKSSSRSNKRKSDSNKKKSDSSKKIGARKSICDDKTLNNCKVVELKEIAKKNKCVGYSKKKKDELITLIKKCRKSSSRSNKRKSDSNKKKSDSSKKIGARKNICDDKTLNNCKVVELKEIAKKSKCVGYSKKKKDELITLIKKCRKSPSGSSKRKSGSNKASNKISSVIVSPKKSLSTKKTCKDNEILIIKTGQCIKKTNGIFINNKIISKISGPTNMIILKPKLEYIKDKLPLFILFGDLHNSEENMCIDCNCDDDLKNCCYPIYSKDFHKFLDNLPENNNFPIDFNIEGGINKYILQTNINSRNLIPEYPLYLTREAIEICYNKKIKIHNPLLYKRKCHTNNIRWQYADSRFHNYPNYKYDFENFLDTFYEIFFTNNDMNFSRLIKYPNHIKYLNIIKHIFDYNFYDYIPKNNSSILKQLKKIEIEYIKNNWKIWLKKYYKYIFSYISNETGLNHDNIKIDLFKDFVNAVKQICYKNKVESNMKIINSFLFEYKNEYAFALLQLNTALLDLYYLFRTFKQPQGSKKTFISIGYFGNRHVNNISYFLTSIMDCYDIVYQHSKEIYSRNRCIKVNDFIDLQSLIDQYKSMYKNL